MKIFKPFHAFQCRLYCSLCARLQHIVMDGIIYFLLTQQIIASHSKTNSVSYLAECLTAYIIDITHHNNNAYR